MTTHQINEAIHWWNAWVSRVPATHRSPKCSIQTATSHIFSKLIPILNFSLDSTKSEKEYWQ
jgi:hypothetical protein